MKKFLTIFFLFVILPSGYSQYYQPFYYGSDYQLFKGTFVKLKDEMAYLHNCFYEDLDAFKEGTTKPREVIYPFDSFKNYSRREMLENRIFFVEEVIEKKTYKYLDRPALVLRDTTSNEVIYYLYPKEEYLLDLVSTPPDYNLDNLCEDIFSKTDEYLNESFFSTPPFQAGLHYEFLLSKFINRENTSFMFWINAYSEKFEPASGTGIITIMFKDGTELLKEAEVNVELTEFIGVEKPLERTYKYSASIPFYFEDAQELATKELYGYKINNATRIILNPVKTFRFKKLAECLIQSE